MLNRNRTLRVVARIGTTEHGSHRPELVLVFSSSVSERAGIADGHRVLAEAMDLLGSEVSCSVSDAWWPAAGGATNRRSWGDRAEHGVFAVTIFAETKNGTKAEAEKVLDIFKAIRREVA